MKKKITNKQFAQALYEVTKNLKGEKLKKILRAFVLLLAKNRKLKKNKNIIAEFIKYGKKQKGIVEIEIKSARELHKETAEKIKKVFGKKVEEQESVDVNLLGGIVVKTENRVLDGSIKRQLQKLRQAMT